MWATGSAGTNYPKKWITDLFLESAINKEGTPR